MNPILGGLKFILKEVKRGMKQGEIKKAIEIAKKMIENNIPLEMIKITTGLSDEEINKLVKKK